MTYKYEYILEIRDDIVVPDEYCFDDEFGWYVMTEAYVTSLVTSDSFEGMGQGAKFNNIDDLIKDLIYRSTPEGRYENLDSWMQDDKVKFVGNARTIKVSYIDDGVIKEIAEVEACKYTHLVVNEQVIELNGENCYSKTDEIPLGEFDDYLNENEICWKDLDSYDKGRMFEKIKPDLDEYVGYLLNQTEKVAGKHILTNREDLHKIPSVK